MARHLSAAVLGFAALAGSGAAWGAELADPTRPPPEFAGPPPVGVEDPGLRLQSVILPRGGKPRAVISGQVVLLGGKLGDATLVRVSEGEAVLQGPLGVERLALTPDVIKTNPPASRKAGAKKEKP